MAIDIYTVLKVHPEEALAGGHTRRSCRRLDIPIQRVLTTDLHFHPLSVTVIQELRNCDMSYRNISRGFFKFWTTENQSLVLL
jgi:hypothetical protein